MKRSFSPIHGNHRRGVKAPSSLHGQDSTYTLKQRHRFEILAFIALVLYLQVTHNAVQTAAEFSLPVLPQLHVAVSTLALLFYFPVLYLGFKLNRDPADGLVRNKHRKLAIPTYFLRTLGFFLMFSMLK